MIQGFVFFLFPWILFKMKGKQFHERRLYRFPGTVGRQESSLPVVTKAYLVAMGDLISDAPPFLGYTFFRQIRHPDQPSVHPPVNRYGIFLVQPMFDLGSAYVPGYIFPIYHVYITYIPPIYDVFI